MKQSDDSIQIGGHAPDVQDESPVLRKPSGEPLGRPERLNPAAVRLYMQYYTGFTLTRVQRTKYSDIINVFKSSAHFQHVHVGCVYLLVSAHTRLRLSERGVRCFTQKPLLRL